MKRNIIVGFLLAILFVSCKKEAELKFEYTKPEVKTSEFTDPRDNSVYQCVEINGQVWMAENFRYRPKASSFYGCYTYHQEPKSVTVANIIDVMNTKTFPADLKEEIMTFMNGGGSAKEVLLKFETRLPAIFFTRLSTMFVPENPFDADYYKEYGLLYNYSAASRYAPEGWRLPTDEDWAALEKSLGMPSEEIAKLDLWRGNGIARGLKEGDEGVGFNAKYAGGRLATDGGGQGDQFFNQGANAYFWSATTTASGIWSVVITRSLFSGNDAILRGTVLPNVAFSARYIKK